MHDLNRKRRMFHWGTEQQEAIVEIKRWLQKTPVLYMPLIREDFISILMLGNVLQVLHFCYVWQYSLFVSGLSRGTVSHKYFIYSLSDCKAQCSSLGSLFFAHLGSIEVKI